MDAEVPAAVVYDPPENLEAPIDEIRIAFDCDAVTFSDEAERIYQEHGPEAFIEHKRRDVLRPLLEGPFTKLLKTLAYLQAELTGEKPPSRTALLTVGNSPSHKRVPRTLLARV